jgi:hypothetical protein
MLQLTFEHSASKICNFLGSAKSEVNIIILCNVCLVNKLKRRIVRFLYGSTLFAFTLDT